MINITTIEAARAEIVELRNRMLKGKVTILQKCKILLESLPPLEREFVDVSYFIEAYQMLESGQTKSQSIDRALRLAKKECRELQRTRVIIAAMTWKSSDCFNTTEYIIKDLVPATRYDSELFEQYHNKLLNYIKDYNLKKPLLAKA